MSALWIMAAVLGKLWKKAADLHIALGEPEAFVGEEDKLQAPSASSFYRPA